MNLLPRLRQRATSQAAPIQVAVTGAGLIARGMVRQINLTPAMRTALVVNRSIERGCAAFMAQGVSPHEIVVSDDPGCLRSAIEQGRPAVTANVDALAELPSLDAVVEATGAVEYGARVALRAMEAGTHVVMMNAETDATVGPALRRRADAAGVVYTNSDGDQPGVLMRLCHHVESLGLEVFGAFNCKGFMDVDATPDTIRPWAEKQKTSLKMTTAFTDGTKMNIENAVLANATGLRPDVRGMRGIRTDMANALADCSRGFVNRGIVDYTLGGDFGGGVFVIGYGDDPEFVQPYLQYLKMGPGPFYLFHRGYHLCHFETPYTIAEAVLMQVPTIAPLEHPVAEVVTLAKRDLQPGEILDGIGGYACRGEIDLAENAEGMLPVGLAENAKLVRPIAKGEPIPMDAVVLDDSASTLLQLREEQSRRRELVA